jgi:hypothetical protein
VTAVTEYARTILYAENKLARVSFQAALFSQTAATFVVDQWLIKSPAMLQRKDHTSCPCRAEE